MKLAITSSTFGYSELTARCLQSQYNTVDVSKPYEFHERVNRAEDNLGVTGSLQWCYEHTTAPIIAFFHSDLEIFEQGWDERVLRQFDDPSVGVVGFGGAWQLGEDDIYKKPYELHQLRRIGYMSNTTDAEMHGSRFTGECDVATVDGFAMIVRRELLDRWINYEYINGIGEPRRGWPWKVIPFHNYDNALCIEARRQGYRVRLVGVSCHHHGGQTTVTTAYDEWSRRVLGKPDSEVHADSHRVLYEMGRGILPIRVR